MVKIVPLCWKCGADLGETPLPLGREAKCKSCRAHLHCCRICIFFEQSVSKQCTEPIAEEVKDKIVLIIVPIP